MSGQPDDQAAQPLNPRLRAMMTLRAEWYRAILTALATRLDRAAVPQVLKTGAAMPHFILPNSAGELVASSDVLARGPIVVCFVRGGWCPFCATTLSALDVVLPRIEAAGATLLALAPDTHGHSAALQARLGLRFQILSDVDCGVALQFGVAYRIPPEYRAALLHFGTDLHARQGDGPGFLPMPATFVCDRDGVIRFVQVSGDVTERAEPELIAEMVQALVGAPNAASA